MKGYVLFFLFGFIDIFSAEPTDLRLRRIKKFDQDCLFYVGVKGLFQDIGRSWKERCDQTSFDEKYRFLYPKASDALVNCSVAEQRKRVRQVEALRYLDSAPLLLGSNVARKKKILNFKANIAEKCLKIRSSL